MKNLIHIIFILILALLIAFFTKADVGQVNFYLTSYRLSCSLNFLILVWIISFILTYYCVRLYVNILRLPHKIRRSKVKNALISSRKHLNFAGLHYFEGKYRSCYNEAVKSVKKEFSGDNKFLAFLLAFRSASIMRDEEKKNYVLEEINQFKDSKWQLAKHLMIANNLYNEQHYGQCIDHLNEVLKIDYKHILARMILLKVYLHLANYQMAYQILNGLLKNDLIGEYKANKYKIKVISGLFKELNDIEELISVFKHLDKIEKSSFFFGKQYFNALLRLEEYHLAVNFLEEHLKDEALQLVYTDSILALSKKIKSRDVVDKLFNIATKCLQANRDSYELQMALGILSLQCQQLDKAQAYLEASINLASSQEAYLYLIFIAKTMNNEKLLASTQQKLLAHVYLN